MIQGDWTGHQHVLLYIPDFPDVHSVWCEHVLVVVRANFAVEQPYQGVTVPGITTWYGQQCKLTFRKLMLAILRVSGIQKYNEISI
jgi:hypothetical protein